MKKLTKGQEAEKGRIEGILDDARSRVTTAREALTEQILAAIREHTPALNEAIGAWQDAVSEAGEFRDGIVGAMDDYYEERSEKWLEGEAASSFESWKSEWEGFDTDPGTEDALDLIFQEAKDALAGEEPEGIPTLDDLFDYWMNMPLGVD